MTIKIDTLQPNYYPQAQALADKLLGENYVEIDNSRWSVMLGAWHNDTLAGYTLARQVAPHQLNKALLNHELSLPNYIKSANEMGTIGKLDGLAIEPAFQRQGIGRKLQTARLQALTDLGCTVIVATAWQHPVDGLRAKKLLAKNHFEQVDYIKNYWQQDGLQKGYDCSYCGPVCQCSAYLFAGQPVLWA